MRAALGPLQWTPAVFWTATPHELVAASEGPAVIHAQTKTARIRALGKKVEARRGNDSRGPGTKV